VCAGPYLRPNTIGAYFNAIEHFSVASGKCESDADRRVLCSKIAHYYTSVSAFEEFAKVSAIGLLAVTVVESGRPAEVLPPSDLRPMHILYATYLTPWPSQEIPLLRGFFFCMNETSVYPPLPTCIGHTAAILLHDYCAVYYTS